MEELKIQIAEQGQISTNLETLKAELKEIAGRYEGVLVSEDTVPLAKKDLAELRKLRTDIEDRRKAVKKQWNEPYTAFENEVKSALAIIDEPINEIDKQVKDFEKADKETKREKIKQIYKSYIPADIEPYMPFETVFDEKWLNKSTKENEIVSDLSAKATQIKVDLDAIKALKSEIEDECLKAYKDAGNSLAAAIKRNTDYLSAKAAAEVRAREEAERKVREEQERKAREEQERKEREESEKEIPTAEKYLIKDDLIPDEEDLPFPVEDKGMFEICGAENIDKVRQFLDSWEIPYRYTEV